MEYAPAGHNHFNTSLCFTKLNNSIIVWAGLVLIGALGAIMTKSQLGFRGSYPNLTFELAVTFHNNCKNMAFIAYCFPPPLLPFSVSNGLNKTY